MTTYPCTTNSRRQPASLGRCWLTCVLDLPAVDLEKVNCRAETCSREKEDEPEYLLSNWGGVLAQTESHHAKQDDEGSRPGQKRHGRYQDSEGKVGSRMRFD